MLVYVSTMAIVNFIKPPNNPPVVVGESSLFISLEDKESSGMWIATSKQDVSQTTRCSSIPSFCRDCLIVLCFDIQAKESPFLLHVLVVAKIVLDTSKWMHSHSRRNSWLKWWWKRGIKWKGHSDFCKHELRLKLAYELWSANVYSYL